MTRRRTFLITAGTMVVSIAALASGPSFVPDSSFKGSSTAGWKTLKIRNVTASPPHLWSTGDKQNRQVRIQAHQFQSNFRTRRTG